MKPRTQKSMELYNTLLNRGFPQEFCEQISLNLNTDWTAQRMLGYLSHYRKLPMAEIVDEMLAILVTGTGLCRSMNGRIQMRNGMNF